MGLRDASASKKENSPRKKENSHQLDWFLRISSRSASFTSITPKMSSEAQASPQPHFKSGTIEKEVSHSEKTQNQTWKCVEHLHPDLVVLFIQTLSVKLVENTFNDFQRVLTCWKVRVFKNSFEDDISIFAPRFLPWARHSPGGRTTCHLPPCLLSHRGPGQQAQVVIQDWVGDCFYTSQTYYRTSVMVKLMPIIDDGVVVTVLLYQNGVGVFF